MPRTVRSASAVLVLPLALSVAPGSGIAWEPYFEAGLRDAQAKNRVVLVAVNMDDEASNDLMLKLYKDKRVLELAGRTVNLIASPDEHSSGKCRRFGSLTCEDHRTMARAVRGEIVKYDRDDHVVAPQHVFLAPNGDVLLSVPYAVTAEELLWCFVTAMAKVDPGGAPTMPEGACPPRRLIMKDVCNSGTFMNFVRPLTEDELEDTIQDLRSGWGAISGMGRFSRILATDHRDALKFATTELGTGVTAWSPELTGDLIRTVARFSPASYWKALEPCLKHHGPEVRAEAAAALEQLGAAKSLSLIRRTLAREDDVDVKKNLIRALGSAGADSSAVGKTLMKMAGSEDERLLRLNAVLALGYHAERDEVREFLIASLRDGDAETRQAAGMAMAFSRIGSYREPLHSAREKESEQEVASLLARATTVLDGDNLRVLARDYERIGGDDVRRERFFGE